MHLNAQGHRIKKRIKNCLSAAGKKGRRAFIEFRSAVCCGCFFICKKAKKIFSLIRNKLQRKNTIQIVTIKNTEAHSAEKETVVRERKERNEDEYHLFPIEEGSLSEAEEELMMHPSDTHRFFSLEHFQA